MINKQRGEDLWEDDEDEGNDADDEDDTESHDEPMEIGGRVKDRTKWQVKDELMLSGREINQLTNSSDSQDRTVTTFKSMVVDGHIVHAEPHASYYRIYAEDRGEGDYKSDSEEEEMDLSTAPSMEWITGVGWRDRTCQPQPKPPPDARNIVRLVSLFELGDTNFAEVIWGKPSDARHKNTRCVTWTIKGKTKRVANIVPLSRLKLGEEIHLVSVPEPGGLRKRAGIRIHENEYFWG